MQAIAKWREEKAAEAAENKFFLGDGGEEPGHEEEGEQARGGCQEGRSAREDHQEEGQWAFMMGSLQLQSALCCRRMWRHHDLDSGEERLQSSVPVPR